MWGSLPPGTIIYIITVITLYLEEMVHPGPIKGTSPTIYATGIHHNTGMSSVPCHHILPSTSSHNLLQHRPPHHPECVRSFWYQTITHPHCTPPSPPPPPTLVCEQPLAPSAHVIRDDNQSQEASSITQTGCCGILGTHLRSGNLEAFQKASDWSGTKQHDLWPGVVLSSCFTDMFGTF